MLFYYRKQADPIHIRLREDEVFKFQLDCNLWVEDNGTVTSGSLVATVRSGDVTAGTPTVSSNVITMTLSNTSEGSSRVELKFGDSSGFVAVQNIFVRFLDRDATLDDDYGLSWA